MQVTESPCTQQWGVRTHLGSLRCSFRGIAILPMRFLPRRPRWWTSLKAFVTVSVSRGWGYQEERPFSVTPSNWAFLIHFFQLFFANNDTICLVFKKKIMVLSVSAALSAVVGQGETIWVLLSVQKWFFLSFCLLHVSGRRDQGFCGWAGACFGGAQVAEYMGISAGEIKLLTGHWFSCGTGKELFCLSVLWAGWGRTHVIYQNKYAASTRTASITKMIW